MLENVDRLIKSPAKQRGRDFGIILFCFNNLGYDVEWRVINAAEYGFQQRRKRIFIFAYKRNTVYFNQNKNLDSNLILLNKGFFSYSFPVNKKNECEIREIKIPNNLESVSNSFSFSFENSGIMREGKIYTLKTEPNYQGTFSTLRDIIEKNEVNESLFIKEEKLYYTNKDVSSCDETVVPLGEKERKTWQYIKGGKRIIRKKNNFEYVYSEGSMPMIDSYDKPARTLLTSEGSFSRTTHIVEDYKTGKIRLLTAEETERIQGFPTGYTKYGLHNGEKIELSLNKRRFLMGNALVVDLIKIMEKKLSEIFENEV